MGAIADRTDEPYATHIEPREFHFHWLEDGARKIRRRAGNWE